MKKWGIVARVKKQRCFTKKDDITSFYDVKPDKQELILNAMYTYFEKK